MENPQYAILRFAKYKGPEISRIEAHDERTKETYASNPDVDTTRSHLNYHLIQPQNHYRIEAERQIADAGCRTRSDSVRLVETLITGSPEFFQEKTEKQIKAYFQHALAFLQERQRPDTFISAVVHMDEKTPHMHMTFVPLTEDNRLTAKEIIGNRKKLTQWQDEYSYLATLIAAAQAAAEDFCRRSFAENMPEPVRLAIYLYVGFMYTYRENASQDAYRSMKQAFDALLWPHRDPTKIL